MPGNIILPEALDVDFPLCPEFIMGDQGMPCFADFGPSYEDLFGVMSEAEIREAIDQETAAGGGLDLLTGRIFNQKNEGSCVGNAFTKSHEIMQAKQYGLHRVIPLSASSLYQLIGRSPSSGATVSSGIEAMCKRGIIPLDTPENRLQFGEIVMPATGFHVRRPRGWEPVAKLFTGLEYHIARSVIGILSALAQGHVVVVGRQGHSIVYVRVMLNGNAFVAKYANSWNDTWGDEGFGYDSRRQIELSANWAVVIRSVVVTPFSIAA